MLTASPDRFAKAVVGSGDIPAYVADRTVGSVIGVPRYPSSDSKSLSLGTGWVIVDMGAGTEVVDREGDDLRVYEHDKVWNSRWRSDRFEVFVSNDPQHWTSIGVGRGTATFDLAPSGLKTARYVRILGINDQGIHKDAGPDIAGIEAIHYAGPLSSETTAGPGQPDMTPTTVRPRSEWVAPAFSLPGEHSKRHDVARAGDRYALVVGSGTYPDAPLRNAVRDAEAVAEMLEQVGFTVCLRTDPTRRELIESIQAFGDKLNAAVAVFYYSGHGAQVDSENYIIPVDAVVRTEADIPFEAVAVARVLEHMRQRGSRLNIVLLDACRNNPFERTFRSSDRGFARMSAPPGTILSYATAPGAVAADGHGPHSPYTEALLSWIARPDIVVEALLKSVARAVQDATGGRQRPWFSSDFIGEFAFVEVKG